MWVDVRSICGRLAIRRVRVKTATPSSEAVVSVIDMWSIYTDKDLAAAGDGYRYVKNNKNNPEGQHVLSLSKDHFDEGGTNTTPVATASQVIAIMPFIIGTKKLSAETLAAPLVSIFGGTTAFYEDLIRKKRSEGTTEGATAGAAEGGAGGATGGGTEGMEGDATEDDAGAATEGCNKKRKVGEALVSSSDAMLSHEDDQTGVIAALTQELNDLREAAALAWEQTVTIANLTQELEDTKRENTYLDDNNAYLQDQLRRYEARMGLLTNDSEAIHTAQLSFAARIRIRLAKIAADDLLEITRRYTRTNAAQDVQKMTKRHLRFFKSIEQVRFAGREDEPVYMLDAHEARQFLQWSIPGTSDTVCKTREKCAHMLEGVLTGALSIEVLIAHCKSVIDATKSTHDTCKLWAAEHITQLSFAEEICPTCNTPAAGRSLVEGISTVEEVIAGTRYRADVVVRGPGTDECLVVEVAHSHFTEMKRTWEIELKGVLVQEVTTKEIEAAMETHSSSSRHVLRTSCMRPAECAACKSAALNAHVAKENKKRTQTEEHENTTEEKKQHYPTKKPMEDHVDLSGIFDYVNTHVIKIAPMMEGEPRRISLQDFFMGVSGLDMAGASKAIARLKNEKGDDGVLSYSEFFSNMKRFQFNGQGNSLKEVISASEGMRVMMIMRVKCVANVRNKRADVIIRCWPDQSMGDVLEKLDATAGAAEGGVGGATGGAAEDAMEGDAGGSAEGEEKKQHYPTKKTMNSTGIPSATGKNSFVMVEPVGVYARVYTPASLCDPMMVAVPDSVRRLTGRSHDACGRIVRRIKDSLVEPEGMALVNSFSEHRFPAAPGVHAQMVKVASAPQLTQLIRYFPNVDKMCVYGIADFFVRVFGGDIADHVERIRHSIDMKRTRYRGSSGGRGR
jgi:hypothetical protein